MTKKLKVYHLPTCSTCKGAIKALKQYGYELELHDIRETPPSAGELGELIARSGLPIGKWFNVSGDAYRGAGLKDVVPGLTDDEKIRLLASNGMLIKRPIVTDGGKATIGFREPDFGSAWDKR
ncbi:ArsC/Spx/MgsR family protein [Paenibacillaceae bacterium WGS1546]|uniref:ArsC/Spx/MgsR family protein n=1 Tax=Cohnella sp. WGS1546 TaxID=3366810 RepID=UPI00372D0B4B